VILSKRMALPSCGNMRGAGTQAPGSGARPWAGAGRRLGCCGVSEGELLTGDGVTQGIVRIGDTVRRPLRPFSLTVQAYLAHLRDAGFTGAPLPFGVDEQGREMLSFVPGDVPRNPLPPETAGDDVLVALARLIRALHEARPGGCRRPARCGAGRRPTWDRSPSGPSWSATATTTRATWSSATGCPSR
jgi:hypothetical protein